MSADESPADIQELLNKCSNEEGTFNESGKNDREREDRTGSAGITACRFGSFGTDDPDAKTSSDSGHAGLDTACEFAKIRTEVDEGSHEFMS